MTDHFVEVPKGVLSPGAQKVLMAAGDSDYAIIAAALHAVASQMEFVQDILKLLAIATELENQPMTDHPRIEVPFDVVTEWEGIEGSCARFYAAAEWGYKKGLKEQRSFGIRELADQVASPIPDDCRYDVFNRQLDIRAKLLAIATELKGQ
jgi:hypothetical protein